MIDFKTEREQLQQVLQALTNHQLLDGMKHLQALTMTTADTALQTKADSLMDAYTAALQQLTSGEISMDAWTAEETRLVPLMLEAHSHLSRTLMLGHETCVFTKTVHNLQHQDWKTEWRNTIDEDERFLLQDNIFDAIWTSPTWSDTDCLWWYDFTFHQNELVQQHWLGAVIASLWMFWDANKLHFITMFLTSGFDSVRLLATLGFTITAQSYPDTLRYYPTLIPEDNPTLHAEIQLLQREFILMQETIMLEEEESKALDQLGCQSPTDESKLSALVAIHKRFAQQHIAHGLDQSFGKRAMLHLAPFLHRQAHWWAPFDEARSEVSNACYDAEGQIRTGYQLLIQANHECDLQHYLSCMLISSPNIRMEIHGDMPEDFLDRLDHTPLPVHKRHVHNLYRIATQSPAHQFLTPIFTNHLFVHNPILQRYFTSTEVIQHADYILSLSLPVTVLSHLLSIMTAEGLSAPLARLIARAYQNENQDFLKALNYYQQADLLDPADEATLRRMALCAHASNKMEVELDLLTRLKALNSDSTACVIGLASILYKQKKYAEARTHLFQVIFQRPDTLSAWAQLALSELHMGDMQQAEKHIAELWQRFPHEPLTHICAALLHLLSEDMSQAIRVLTPLELKHYPTLTSILQEFAIPSIQQQALIDSLTLQNSISS